MDDLKKPQIVEEGTAEREDNAVDRREFIVRLIFDSSKKKAL